MNAVTDAQPCHWLALWPAEDNAVLRDAQLLAAIAGNNGSLRSVVFSWLRLPKQVAFPNLMAEQITAEMPHHVLMLSIGGWFFEKQTFFHPRVAHSLNTWVNAEAASFSKPHSV